MKTTLSLITAFVLGSALLVRFSSVEPTNLVAIAFALALAVWTARQYQTPARSLTAAKPIHLAIVRSKLRQVAKRIAPPPDASRPGASANHPRWLSSPESESLPAGGPTCR